MSSCLKRAIAYALAATALVACAAGAATAATITADLTKVGGNTWDASFTVQADVGQTVEAFSIYFDWTQVSNLAVWASPANWDSFAIPEDAALMSDGYFDALALATGMSDSEALGGFIARFDWADAAGPAMLRYTINDPLTYAALEAGVMDLRVAGGPSTVDESPTWMLLLAAGLVSLLTRQRPNSGAMRLDRAG